MRNLVWVGLAALIGFAGVQAVQGTVASNQLGALTGSCVIKGNVSINSGEHIYHVPGQHYYASTIIRPEYGERWFCSEAEALAAGWRRAGY